jgi:hypothetical protein
MLFVDHKTKLVYPSFQGTKTGEEACRSKGDYETFAKDYIVNIHRCHTNNGAFCTSIFQKAIDRKVQNINFSGVDAQWKNGLVEKSNCTLCAEVR